MSEATGTPGGPPKFKRSLFGANRRDVAAALEESARQRVLVSIDLNAAKAELAALIDETERQRLELAQLTQALAAAQANLTERGEEVIALRLQLAESTGVVSNLEREVEQLRREVTHRDAQEQDVREALVQVRQSLEAEKEGAQTERRLVLEAANRHADEILQRAQRRVSDEGWELHRAKVERQRFIEGFRALLLKHLEDLDRMMATTTPISAPVQSPSTPSYVPPATHPPVSPSVQITTNPIPESNTTRLFVPPGFEAPADLDPHMGEVHQDDQFGGQSLA